MYRRVLCHIGAGGSPSSGDVSIRVSDGRVRPYPATQPGKRIGDVLDGEPYGRWAVGLKGDASNRDEGNEQAEDEQGGPYDSHGLGFGLYERPHEAANRRRQQQAEDKHNHIRNHTIIMPHFNISRQSAACPGLHSGVGEG